MKKQIKEKRKSLVYKLLRVFAWTLVSIVIFLFVLQLFLRSPWGQDIVVQRALKYVSTKTHTKVAIERLYFTIHGNIYLQGLYLEDKKGDTLVYSNSLELNIPMLPILRGKGIQVKNLDWRGLRANIIQNDTLEGYNFQFLVDAFASGDSEEIPENTDSKPLAIDIDKLYLNDFEISYKDVATGIDSKFKMGELSVAFDKIDLEQMDFRINSSFLSDVYVYLKQDAVLEKIEEDASETKMPNLAIKHLKLHNVLVDYEDKESKLKADLNLGNFSLKMPKADFANKQVLIDLLSLKNTTALVKLYDSEGTVTQIKEEGPIAKLNTPWPDFVFLVKEVDMAKNNFSYVRNDSKLQLNIFNPDVLHISDFTLKAKDIFLKEEEAGLQLKAFSFKEASGIDLKDLVFNVSINEQQLELDKLKLHLNNNRLNGKAIISYNSLQKFVDHPEASKFVFNLPNFQLDVKDAFRFQPDLRKNESILALSNNYLTGSLSVSGGLTELEVPKASLSWGNTKINAKAWVQHLDKPEKLAFELSKFEANTTNEDLAAFVDQEALGLNLPKEVGLLGEARGDLKDLYTKISFTSSQGDAIFDGHWTDKEAINFAAALEIKEYKLNELLKEEAFGNLSFKLNTQGDGKDINTLNMDMQANLSDFSYMDYQIKGLLLEADIVDGKGRFHSKYKDAYLDYTLNSNIILDSVSPEFNLHFDLKGANLQKLGLLDRDVRTSFKLDADFNGNANEYEVVTTIGDGLFIYDDNSYLLGDLLATAHVESDTTSIWVNNKIAKLQLQSNAKPEEVFSSMKNYVNSYLSKQLPDSTKIERPIKMYVRGEINEDPLLNKVFLKQVERLDTVRMHIDYDSEVKRLVAGIHAPHINYAGNELIGLGFNINAIQEDFNFVLGFDNIKAGPLDIPKTKIQGEQRDQEFYLNLHATKKNEVLLHLPWVISGDATELKFHVLAENLIINKEKWDIPEDNEIRFSKEALVLQNFEFSKGKERVRYSNDLMQIDSDQLAVSFENFNLEVLFNYLNPKAQLAHGELNGELVVVNPFDKPAILADLSISDLALLDINLGKLSLKARALDLNKYDFYLGLKEGMLDLDLKGGYTTLGESPEMNLKLAIHDFQLAALEGFSLGELRNGVGSFKGNFDISGPLNNLVYNGNLDFLDAGFTVSKFNAGFSLLDSSLAIDNKGIYFQNFKLYDAFNNKLEINGKVHTEEITNPSFDLKVISDNFHVINASAADNDFLYGKAAFSLDMNIKGDLLRPVVNMKGTISEDTDITYILSTANASLESRDGVIAFVNRQDPEAVLSLKEEQPTFKAFGGLDFKGKIKLGDKAKATVILDKQTGDNFQIYGNGEFDVRITPNGSMSLSGVYNVGGGHYEMNLYNLVNRKFSLVKGGRVTWNGDIMDADLNVQAKYQVDASASPLMAAISSGADQATQNKFRQVLPFLVYLKIGGELMAPEIAFNLDMPEEQQAAIGGQVYGRIQQLNQQEDELNRQVFSLLVMNRFFPDSGSDGSQGGFAHIMRNNINDAISDQLNTFSDKLLGNSGIKLDFGLESFTDYQGESPEERTQLDIAAQKKLFDDRLIMRVGSEVDLVGSANNGEEANPIIGNVSIEYLLTPSGRYSLRGFRKNTYDNVMDGQLVVNGISLVFTQEYNSIHELWQALLRGETKEEKEDRKNQEALEKEKKEKKSEVETQLKNQKKELKNTRFEINEENYSNRK